MKLGIITDIFYGVELSIENLIVYYKKKYSEKISQSIIDGILHNTDTPDEIEGCKIFIQFNFSSLKSRLFLICGNRVDTSISSYEDGLKFICGDKNQVEDKFPITSKFPNPTQNEIDKFKSACLWLDIKEEMSIYITRT